LVTVLKEISGYHGGNYAHPRLLGWDAVVGIPTFQMYLPPTLAFIYLDSKGKAISLQAWTGPEGSRRLRLPDFKTVGT
jgi:hypothetical protein